MDNNQELRLQLTHMLTVSQAHTNLEDVLENFPEEHINERPANCEYTFWHLLEHIRICQRDIIEYIQSEDYHWLNFPDDLWPERSAITDRAGWQKSLEQFLEDRQELDKIINDPAVDLFAPLINSGEYRHSTIRVVNIIACHNSYHTGEFSSLRGSMKI